MKLSRIFGFALILGLFSSCVQNSDDIEVVVPNYTDFIGTWDLESYSYTGYATYDTNGVVDTTATYVASSIILDADVEFTQNPNTIVTSGTGSIDVSLTIGGITITQTEDSVLFDGNGTWGAAGDTITIDFASFGADVSNSSAYISSFTDSTATILGVAEFTQDTLGYELDHHIDYTLNLVKN